MLSNKKRVDKNNRLLASSWHWHIKSLSTPCGGQPESQFGADYLRKNHLSQKFAELRYIERIVARTKHLKSYKIGPKYDEYLLKIFSINTQNSYFRRIQMHKLL